MAINLTWQRYVSIGCTAWAWGWGVCGIGWVCAHGFIYCGQEATQSYKTYGNVLVSRLTFLAPLRGVRQVSGPDKDEKRYVNFIRTDVKIKPFIFVCRHPLLCIWSRPRRWQIYDSGQIGNLFVYALSSTVQFVSDRVALGT